MRYWEITQKEKQDYSLEELSRLVAECIPELTDKPNTRDRIYKFSKANTN